jgi:hypothetical protein
MRITTLRRLACLSLLAISSNAFGAFMEFNTPCTATCEGKGVDANIQITTSHNQIAIVLDNTQCNVNSIFQDLSGLELTLGTPENSASMLWSLDNSRTVQTGGAWCDSKSKSSTGWTVSMSYNLIVLNAPAATGKNNLSMIGAPNQSTNQYESRQGIWFSPCAQFTILCPGVTSSTTITHADFLFGAGTQIGATVVELPEPASLSLLSLAAIPLLARRRSPKLASIAR